MKFKKAATTAELASSAMQSGDIDGHELLLADLTNGRAVGKAKLLFMSTTPKDLSPYPVKVDGADVLIGLP